MLSPYMKQLSDKRVTRHLRGLTGGIGGRVITQGAEGYANEMDVIWGQEGHLKNSQKRVD